MLNVYPLDLGATEAQQLTVSSIAMLPCTFKVLYGFLSDQVPLFGYRRKGYMLLGWLQLSISMCALMASSNLNVSYESLDEDQDTVADTPDPLSDAPSIQLLSLYFLVFGMGLWMADVMGDSLVVRHSRGCCQMANGSRAYDY